MLSIGGLRRATGDGPAIGPIDLEVPAGRIVALMGASGAGKSLLLRAIADLDPATGAISLDGTARETMDGPQWRRHVVYVAAQAGWWEDIVGRHFADPAAALVLLPRLGLPVAAMDWPVERLSSGERQRLALARAIALPRPAGSARAYLLDEPTAALDSDSAGRAEAVIAALPDDRTAVLLVTHDAAQARRLGNGGTLHLRDGGLTP